jgi:putative transcriptional regulator
MDGLLAGYAAGSLPRPFQALVGAHLELSPRYRGFVSDLESIKGSDLSAAEPIELRRHGAMLSAILDAPRGGDAVASAGQAASPGVSVLPVALRTYIGRDLSDIRWRFRLPGVKEYVIENRDGVSASMLWVSAGRRMPQHTHDGLEATLLLQGGFRDEGAHYRRGDVAIGEHDVDHQPVADADEDCLCFAVNEGDTHLTGTVGRMLRGLIGR